MMSKMEVRISDGVVCAVDRIAAFCAAAWSPAATRFVDSITAIENNGLMVNTDAGELHLVAVPATAAHR
jgi:hypothetical protein